jgi:hypothetical protein
MQGGRLDALLMEKAELDIGGALALNAVSAENAVEIRCLIADFKVRNGIMKTETLLVDTVGTKVTGRGTIELGAHWFADITLQAKVKDFSLPAGDAPLHIHGSVRDLSVDVSWPRLLFSLLTPIELGAADNADCGQLTRAMRRR